MAQQKHISIRIDAETLKKFHHIANYDDRSASGEIMFLINNHIRDFEAEHGKIDIVSEDIPKYRQDVTQKN